MSSHAALGAYTEGVDRFLAEEHQLHSWREDVTFAARPRVEYHLNMVGAELMNRAERAAFLDAPRKDGIVPACIRFSRARTAVPRPARSRVSAAGASRAAACGI